MLFDRDPKLQGDTIPTPEGLPSDVIVILDTLLNRRFGLPGVAKSEVWERNGYHMLDDPWRKERFGL